ncbi:hypothetical protein MuYL_3145 [Mucilaginibacter xinganensis]|uniref:Uncharacterized protein n=1 Tax=Mucilaginibacter xinganensis TaxID=1234841 RepID=A0A223NZ35_9SPHI|nr:hypothetical protein MuYL_3145 [Mucilaginibacter xinganensis]
MARYSIVRNRGDFNVWQVRFFIKPIMIYLCRIFEFCK